MSGRASAQNVLAWDSTTLAMGLVRSAGCAIKLAQRVISRYSAH